MGAPTLLLASGSPQRRAILEQLGVSFEVLVTGAEELTAGPPEEVALENAYRKAAAARDATAAGAGSQASHDRKLILGVDTLVALGPRIYGKPAGAAQARETLRALSGRTHRVLSGVCLIDGQSVRSAAAVTSVHFRELDGALLDWYLSTEEWRGRAGGYAIQGRGAALVRGIEGDYLNVVGLPVATLLELLPGLLGG